MQFCDAVLLWRGELKLKGVCASVCVERECSACVFCGLSAGLSARGPLDLGRFRSCTVRKGGAHAGRAMRERGCR